MLDRLYLKRLRADLEHWGAKGWVMTAHQELILEDAALRARESGRGPLALAVLGAIMFGAGVITFLAANWQVIPKAAKLGILFGGLWLAYAAAGWLLSRSDSLKRGFGQALLLLGLLLFGACIMLIGQIYHLDPDPPGGVLLWALGGLLLAFLVPGEPVAAAALLLACLWAVLVAGERMDLDQPQLVWPFLAIWAALLWQSLRRGWRQAQRLAGLSLCGWIVLAALHLIAVESIEAFYATQLCLLAFLCLFLLGGLMEQEEWRPAFGVTLQRQAAVFGLGALYLLGLRASFKLDSLTGGSGLAAPGETWFFATVGLGALTLLLCLAILLRREPEQRPAALWAGMGLALIAVALMIGNLVMASHADLAPLAYLAVNLLLLATLAWFIQAGYRRQDSFRVNLAFLLFALWILTLYFHAFWSLMDRSFFFMGGGAILFLGGWLLDRQRRRLLRSLGGIDEDSAEEGETAP